MDPGGAANLRAAFRPNYRFCEAATTLLYHTNLRLYYNPRFKMNKSVDCVQGLIPVSVHHEYDFSPGRWSR